MKENYFPQHYMQCLVSEFLWREDPELPSDLKTVQVTLLLP